jgi:hypothetical protein
MGSLNLPKWGKSSLRRIQRQKQGTLDPRLGPLLALLKQPVGEPKSYVWPERPSSFPSKLSLIFKYQIKPENYSVWWGWCARVLKLGSHLGLRIVQQLLWQNNRLVADWEFSCDVLVEDAAHYEVRLLEAVKQLESILKAAR